MDKLAKKTNAKNLQRFPALRDRIVEVVNLMLQRQLKPTNKMIENIISIEKAYINTSHPDFVGGPNAIKNAYNKANSQPREAHHPHPHPSAFNLSNSTNGDERSTVALEMEENDDNPVMPVEAPVLSFLFNKNDQHQPKNGNGQLQEIGVTDTASGIVEIPKAAAKEDIIYESHAINDMDCEIIKELMRSYLEVTRKNVEDLVPKTIMYFLVNFARDHIQNELVREVYNNRNEYNNYLKEDPSISVSIDLVFNAYLVATTETEEVKKIFNESIRCVSSSR